MSATQPLSYSAALSDKAGQRAETGVPGASHAGDGTNQGQSAQEGGRPQQKRSPSPAHRPQGVAEDEDVYVLTILTDKPHHDRMTTWRKQHFPKRINKLEAHLTLFHALPGSKMDSSIIPVIHQVAGQTSPYKVRAQKPFRLKRGIAISVAKSQGGRQTQDVHKQLQQAWMKEGFLSEQDQGGCHVHYTIMNKVDHDDEVSKAFAEVQERFRDDLGRAEGLALWKYDRGWWRKDRRFLFEGDAGGSDEAGATQPAATKSG